MKNIAEIETALVALPHLDGRPVATVAEISDLCQIQVSTVYNWIGAKRWKLRRAAGSLYYADDVLAILRPRRPGPQLRTVTSPEDEF